ncbi:hypothetical protein HK100_005820 [Physocladia obscura]|uniref:Phosphatase PP2A regulatory subunit A/Splicing factor 3B subunit 1-like HEAT repeat domain-containing protein n=1 Tax=Physocladia obscura TaxID=109957 RepID=A0AAD5TBH4_9FUNG|nr:hypothetical protein HK100_005820 [Physocladia obscura]
MASETQDLYPIAVLIDELKHDDVALRLAAIRRISTIALALGADRTRDELIPFLDESIDDEDEVLLALAEELGSFVEFVGGPPFAHLLLTPLETLAAVEETVVREKAVESTAKIGQILSSAQIEEFYIPMVNRLSKGDWFTSRTSACGLYAPIYHLASARTQEDLRALYSTLCKDETPMVRRAGATNLAKLVKKLSKQHVVTEMFPLFSALAQDEQDSVRLLTVEGLISIAEVLSPEETKAMLLNILRSMCVDKSWRVRYMIAEKFVAVSKSVGADIIKEDLIHAFVQVLKDNEAEVRTAASTQAPGFSAMIDKETVLREILPCIRDLVVDSSQHVRAALATEISGFAPILGKENTIEHLLPLFLQLLKDEASEVRLNIISKLDKVNDVIGIELLSQSLLPAIVELAEDKQWRVRLAIIENIPLLASQLGVKFFDEKLGALCMSWLGDCVFSIREAATTNLRKLTEVFGYDWAKQTIIPKVLAMGQHSNYLYRMTTIFAITTLAHVVNGEVLKDLIVPTVTSLATDPIPNIRFNVAKSMEELVPLLKKTGLSGLLGDPIKPSLLKLSEDKDTDVRFFANRALAALAA